MQLVQMGCCAFNEIRDLHSHRGASSAMKAFCQQTFTQFGFRKIGAFYIFTAVVKSTSSDRYGVGKYGDNFAAFIAKNKLGNVTPTMVRTNRRNAPSHHVKGWVWAPNEKNLKAWWKAQSAKNGGGNG